MRQVVFFPENKLSATICDMYNGHVAAVSHNTDQLRNGNHELVELELFRNNIQGTAFLGKSHAEPQGSAYFNKLREIDKTGRIGYGVYYATSDNGQSQEQILANTVAAQEFFEGILGYKLAGGSYANGITSAARYYKPSFLGMRNSDFSYVGDADVRYLGLTRKDLMSKPSSTRTYDATDAYGYLTEAESLAYSASQVQRAIDTNGWYNDFMHWHHMYRDNRTYFFGDYFAMLNAAIGSADVWRATMSEVSSYVILKNCIRRVGSFEHSGKVYVSVHLKDEYKGVVTDGVDDAIDTDLLTTPLSIEIDLAGTALAGKNIACDRARMIRRLSANKWIVSVKPQSFKEGYFTFEIKETAGTTHYYNPATPNLSVNGTTVISNMDCKFVVWRKLAADDDRLVSVVSRTIEYGRSVPVTIESGYTYYVGAISRSNMSSSIKVN